ncbi:MAG: hypothetical protein K2M95_05700 [Clostridiales bacterium]|nr:hypothetical protein [Clostridiales bacterium]
MKKAGKITLITVSSVVGAILIAVIILCCVTVKPLKSFKDYSEIYVTSSTQSLPDGAVKTKYKKKIDKNLDDAGFSVMHAMLEFVYSYGPEFVTEKDEDDNTVRKEMTVNEARSACAATANSYMLELRYDTMKTFKVKKETVSYNTLIMNVHTTDGELHWINVYLFDRYMSGEGNPAFEDYRITPIRMRMNTSALYIALGEIEQELLG